MSTRAELQPWMVGRPPIALSEYLSAPSPDVIRRHPTSGVSVGPFIVADRSFQDLVGDLVLGSVSVLGQQPFTAYALHVGGLNARADRDYVAAMESADAVYADGVSVVLLARLAGGRRIERAGTTDLGWQVLREMSDVLQRPARVALLGGAAGVAADAGLVLTRDAGVEVVAVEHGFHDDWAPVLERLRASSCDVLLVGLGAPFEMKWVNMHHDKLPSSLIMTCGGWFGFLTNAERRAPLWMQRLGLEWTFRLLQAPSRLGRRYGVGALTTARLAALLALRRALP